MAAFPTKLTGRTDASDEETSASFLPLVWMENPFEGQDQILQSRQEIFDCFEQCMDHISSVKNKTEALMLQFVPQYGDDGTGEKTFWLPEIPGHKDGRKFSVYLMAWDLNESTGERSVSNIIMQEIYFPLPVAPTSPARMWAFWQAWALCFTRLPFAFGDDIFWMPTDLLGPSISNALSLKKAHTKEDFLQALLAKSRLGKLVSSASLPFPTSVR